MDVFVVKKYDRIVDYLEGRNDTATMVEIYNTINLETSAAHGYVCDMDCLGEILYGMSPDVAISKAYYGDFNPNHEYFTFDGYGNLTSFNYWDECNSPILVGEIAQYCVENDQDFRLPEIREILDEDEDEDEGG